jgi:hypothetical protein
MERPAPIPLPEDYNIAISNGDLDTLKRLLRDASEGTLNRALAWTISGLETDAALEITKYLVESGADVNNEDNDCTPLEYLMRFELENPRSRPIIEYLIQVGAKQKSL